LLEALLRLTVTLRRLLEALLRLTVTLRHLPMAWLVLSITLVWLLLLLRLLGTRLLRIGPRVVRVIGSTGRCRIHGNLINENGGGAYLRVSPRREGQLSRKS